MAVQDHSERIDRLKSAHMASLGAMSYAGRHRRSECLEHVDKAIQQLLDVRRGLAGAQDLSESSRPELTQMLRRDLAFEDTMKDRLNKDELRTLIHLVRADHRLEVLADE